MTTDYKNRVIHIFLDLANLADEKKETPFERDLGFGYRCFTSYVRRGVQDIIKLQDEYYSVCETRDRWKSELDDANDLLERVFGTTEVTEFNDEEIAKIKAVVAEIEKSWESKDE